MPRTKPAPTIPTAPAVNRCSLTLTIDGVIYRVHPVANPGSGVSKAFRLAREGAEPRTISRTQGGSTCTCEDYHWRKSGSFGACKHLRAASACGLL